MARDLTQRQFLIKTGKRGITPAGMGYWNLAAPVEHISVYAANGGNTNREKLAYLIARQAEAEQEYKAKNGKRS